MEQLPPHPTHSPRPSHAPTGASDQPKKPWYKRWWAIAIAAVIVIGGFASALSGGDEDATATSTDPSASPTQSAKRVDAEPEDSPTPTLTRSSTTPEPSPTSSSAKPTPKPTPTPTEEPDVPADPADYEQLDTRDLALITKNPDSHIGRQAQVYANITQFDAATGDCIFRGNTAYTNMADSWDYEHNSMFMDERGAGPSFSYDTQIGGSTTVPTYIVDGIELVQ